MRRILVFSISVNTTFFAHFSVLKKQQQISFSPLWIRDSLISSQTLAKSSSSSSLMMALIVSFRAQARWRMWRSDAHKVFHRFENMSNLKFNTLNRHNKYLLNFFLTFLILLYLFIYLKNPLFIWNDLFLYCKKNRT